MENNNALTTQKQQFEIMAMPEEASEQLNGIKLVFPQLKMPAAGQTFFEIDETPVKEFFGVVVSHGPSHVYFENDYTGDSMPPDCSSKDGITGYKRLTTELDDEQEYEACSCAECPFNEFGSGKNGGKACKEKHQMYVLPSNSLIPYSLLLPVSSTKILNTYATKLFAKGKYLNQVVTAFSLEKTTNKSGIVYSRIVLKYVRDLTPEEYAQTNKLAEATK
ncbi:MAG: hypothetical protein IKU15_00250 [Clostridia bacterium]|nr:hypothetical protein [Clostridia bacterium]